MTVVGRDRLRRRPSMTKLVVALEKGWWREVNVDGVCGGKYGWGVDAGGLKWSGWVREGQEVRWGWELTDLEWGIGWK